LHTKEIQKKDSEIQFNENNTIQEKALQESQKLLQQHIKGIKEYIVNPEKLNISLF